METDPIDPSSVAFERLVSTLPSFAETLNNEAAVRLKVIDTVLLEVLGWNKAEIHPEEQAGKGYLDYKLTVEGITRIVVEAKKVEREFGLANRSTGAYKISGPALRNDDLQEGIRQAIEYSAYKGVELACVTNGYEWVVFRSSRIGDGTETLDGKAIIFGSLKAIRENFRDFFDLLARARVSNLSFRALFQEAEGRIIRHAGFCARSGLQLLHFSCSKQRSFQSSIA